MSVQHAKYLYPKRFHHSVQPKPPDSQKVCSSTLCASVSSLTSSSCTYLARIMQFIYIKSRTLRIFREPKLLTSEILSVFPSTVCPCRITLSVVKRDSLRCVAVQDYKHNEFASLCSPLGLHCQWSRGIHFAVWPYKITDTMNSHHCVPI